MKLRFTRARGCILAGVMIGILPGSLWAGESTGEDWPRFLGARGNGVSSETGLVEKWPAKGPPLLWEKQVGAGYSAPSVRGSRLVLHHRVGDEEIVECFDATSGQPNWRYGYPSHYVDPYGYNNGPRSTPLLTEAPCYPFWAEGKLRCLGVDGKLIWSRDSTAA